MRWVVAIVALAVGGCAQEEAPASAPAPKPAAAAKAPAVASAPGEEAKPAEPPFSYSPIGKRDPFHSYLADLQEAERNDRRKLEDTERYEIDQYRLTGLVTGTAQPKAMVEDPTGRGHTLHVGSRLGRNGGRVTRITDRDITVTEEIRSPTGDRVLVPLRIKLPRPELLEEPADG